ncbi:MULTISPECIES: hypothetical protein [unclassified Lactococcus]|uniref:hypothetical protein n=1 Tax=unclassified Lactococcus TaxID=2643510 RepID=UPI001C9CF3FC|nr:MULTISPECIES: hypothetical protein [unclassified Lactococcus]
MADQLTGQFFGGIMQTITDYKYIGPGNTIAVRPNEEGNFTAELLLRAEKI